MTSAALKYIVVQVVTDSYLFAEHPPNTGADTVVMLQGVSLSGIDYGISSKPSGVPAMARPAGLEPATARLEGECSIQLS